MAVTNHPGSPLSMLNQGIAQIAIAVEDLDQTVKHYWRTFGIGPWYFYTYQPPLLNMIRFYGIEVDHTFRVARSYFGPTRIELIEVKSGESIYPDFIQEGAGIGPNGDGHYGYLNSEENFGTFFELFERPKLRHPPEWIFPEEDYLLLLSPNIIVFKLIFQVSILLTVWGLESLYPIINRNCAILFAISCFLAYL